MEVDSLTNDSRKRTRSTSQGAQNSSDDDDSASSDAWSDLDDDDWLSKPDAEAQAARLVARGSRTARYTREVTPEKIDSKTPLKDDNVGMKMLKLMGWTPGGGLGARGTGRSEPIPLPEMMNGLGLGKANIETRMLAEAINQGPRILESQKIAVETEEQRLAREAKVASKANVVAVVQETLSKFYCDICSKGYANVAQWEEHLLSYGHNHAKRKKEVAMQSRSLKNNSDEVAKRREKEKRREQMELERILKATGGSLPSTTSAASGAPPLSAAVKAPAAVPGEKKKGGFFKIASTSNAMPAEPSQPPPPPPPSASDAPPPPPLAAQTSLASSAPKFTSSKSSNLKSTWTTWQPPPPTIAPNIPPPPTITPNIPPPPTIASNIPPPPALNAPSSSMPRGTAWKPASAPGLHPLLSGDSNGVPTSADAPPAAATNAKRWHNAVRENRNDFFKREEQRSSSPFELPTAASSINTHRAPKPMAFVSANARPSPSTGSSSLSAKTPGISLGGSAAPRKKALDMMADDEDEEETSGMPLPTGRPRARMPGPAASGGVPKGKIGFGSLSK